MMQKLDQIELADPIIRRHYLVKLLDRRVELEEECRAENQVERSFRSLKVTKYDLRRLQLNLTVMNVSASHRQLEKPDSRAFVQLMTECYPRLPQPEKGRSRPTDTDYIEFKNRLQNRLNAVRNWRSLKNTFSVGILLLVPCDVQTNR